MKNKIHRKEVNMKKTKSGSPAIDLAMKLMFDLQNKIVSEKTITIKITERSGFVDYLVTDNSKIPVTKLESEIWHSIQKVIENKYEINPNSWKKKRIE